MLDNSIILDCRLLGTQIQNYLFIRENIVHLILNKLLGI